VILVDDSFLLALVDRSNEDHEEALSILGHGLAGHAWLTTHLLLGRLWDTFLRHTTPFEATTLIAQIASSRHLKIIPVTQSQQADAFGLLTSFRLPSYVDATSLAVARSHRITETLSFRPDLVRLGLDPIRD